ncbi:MAG: zinc ribbon domain-containing protein, partial [Phaeodactylibacter sp.]|nr:zinc ribbon domain-containing protein [Phaeodactylibacter sp.]
MKCKKCQTVLPSGARFCFNCGARQPHEPKREPKQPSKPLVDLGGDIERQLVELFFQALRRRVEEEHQPEQFQRYSERLYESGFRDTVSRKAAHLGEALRSLDP